MFTRVNNIKIFYSFEDGVRVTVQGPDTLYLVEVKEYPKGSETPKHVEGYVIDQKQEGYFNFFHYPQEFYGDLEILVYRMDLDYGLVNIFRHRYNDRDKIVEFILDTKEYKEAQLWANRIKEYTNVHGCRPVVKSKFPAINKQFQEYYNMSGLEPYKVYRIGRYPKNSKDYKTLQPQHDGMLWFGNWKLYWSYQHPRSWNFLNSQEIVDDILGL